MSTNTKQNLMSYLPIVITIVAYIVGFAFVWGVQSTKISAQADELQDTKDRVLQLEKVNTEILVRLGKIDSNVEFIKNKIGQ